MGARIRITDDDDLEIVGRGKLYYVGTQFADRLEVVVVGTVEGAAPVSLRVLRQAMIRLRRRVMPRARPGECRAWVGLFSTPEESFSVGDVRTPETLVLGLKVPPSSPSLCLDGDDLNIRLDLGRKTKPDLAAVRRLLTPYFDRHKASFKVTVDEHKARGRSPDEEWVVVRRDRFILSVQILWLPRGATVADAWRLAAGAHALLSMAETGEIEQSAALDLLRSGRWDLFVNQPECGWLEAKSEPYGDLKGNGKYELAKDVAAFANAPEGGVVVLGMATRKENEVDTIKFCDGIELNRGIRQRYRSLVAKWVYPLVAGFEVEKIEGPNKGHGLVLLIVPPQPETSKPFLVPGTITEGKVLGNHVLIPIRREDDVSAMDVGGIHARLRLGQQAIIAGKPPREPGKAKP